MMRILLVNNMKIILMLFITFTLLSCGSNAPTKIIFQDKVYELKSSKESSGGKFDIAHYASDTKQIYLIIPDKEFMSEPAFDFDAFAKLYTKTFEAQGFGITSVSNEHIGVSSSKIVYLTVSRIMGALSILIVEKTDNVESTISEASDIFIELKELNQKLSTIKGTEHFKLAGWADEGWQKRRL